MKGKYYTIQIIPEDSEKVRKFKVRTWWFAFIKISLVIFILVLGLFIYHLGKINRIVANYEKMRVTNAQLIKKDNNYEEMFSRLDSLWILESRIQNIFETFLEQNGREYVIHLVSDVTMTREMHEQLIAVSTSGENAAAFISRLQRDTCKNEL